MKVLKFFIAALIFSAITFAQNGKITGTVVDADFGDALIGANVIIEGTMMGAATDLDGHYTINSVPPGTYSLSFSMVSFSTTKVTGVEVKAGEVTKIDIALGTEAIETEEVVITAKMTYDNEAALLKQRQKSISVSDAISSEDISRSGSGDAADALNKVTGASTMDGKYVIIRGLGERYSTTQLNGTEVPSSDPDKRSVQLDMFPTHLLENIVTEKTFTPDKNGNYTGGAVDMRTKSFPEERTFSISMSSSYNTQTTLDDGYLSYDGGEQDWLGIDDGTRDVPYRLSEPDFEVPTRSAAERDSLLGLQLHEASTSFSKEMVPTTMTAPLNQSYSISYGNKYDFNGIPVGFIGSFTYSQKHSFYGTGLNNQWESGGATSDSLTGKQLFSDSKGSQEVLWGGLAQLAFKPWETTEIGFNFMYNHGGDKFARYQLGAKPHEYNDNQLLERRVLGFVERDVTSYQMFGKHSIDALTLENVELEWLVSKNENTQEEPDLRFFNNFFTIRESRDNSLPDGTMDTSYAIDAQNQPQHYFRNLSEKNTNLKVDLTIPFKTYTQLPAKVKVGYSFLESDRSFTERRYQFDNNDNDIYYYFANRDGERYRDIRSDGLFSSDLIGMNTEESDLEAGRYSFDGNWVLTDFTHPSHNYGGDFRVNAFYGMMDYPITKKFRMIFGFRSEYSHMTIQSQDTTREGGSFEETDILPSFSIIYNLIEDVNIRAAYGRTLARPNFRELADYSTFDFMGGYNYLGNPDLERTLVDNFDFRAEWFMRPGEIAAVSAFYKKFDSPIQKVVIDFANNVIQYKNTKDATVYGLEFEVRKRLDQFGEFIGTNLLDNFTFGTNFTLVHSEVTLSDEEYESALVFDSTSSRNRDMQGQSPYILNVDFAYQNFESGTTISLFYNIFGDRLSEIGLVGTPDVYENSRGMLDLIASQKLWWGLSMKFSAKNLLDEPFKRTQDFKGREYVEQEYKKGVTYSFGLKWAL